MILFLLGLLVLASLWAAWQWVLALLWLYRLAVRNLHRLLQ